MRLDYSLVHVHCGPCRREKKATASSWCFCIWPIWPLASFPGHPSCFCGDARSLRHVTYQHPRIDGSVSSGTDLLPMPTFPGVKESVFLPQGGNVPLMTL